MRQLLFALMIAVPGFAAAQAHAQATPAGKWVAEEIGGSRVGGGQQTTLELTDDGRAFGSGGCNRYRGTAEFDATSITFKPLASTKMACEAAVMEQETRFHKAVEQVKSWRIDGATHKLSLLDGNGAVLARFARTE
jgi:heat shock protein HslJ